MAHRPRTSIVAGSAASSASIYNVIQTDGFLCPTIGFKSAVPRLAVVVGSLAGVHSDVLETAAAAVFDIGLQSSS